MFPVAEIREHYWETIEILTQRVKMLDRFRYSISEPTTTTHRAVNIMLRRGRWPTKPKSLSHVPHRWNAAEAAEAGRRGRGKKHIRWRKAS